MTLDIRPAHIIVNCNAPLIELVIAGDWLLDSQIADLELVLVQLGDGSKFKKLGNVHLILEREIPENGY